MLFLRPYFDAKEEAEHELQVDRWFVFFEGDCVFQNQKMRIEAVQKAISQAKKMYRTALNNLERISEEVRRGKIDHFKSNSFFLLRSIRNAIVNY